MNAYDTFESVASMPLEHEMLDYTNICAALSKLPLGTWNHPAFPIPDSHRRIIQPILDEADRKKAYHDLAETYMTSDSALRLTVSKYWNFGKKWGFDKTLPPLQRIRAGLIWYSIAVKDSRDIRDDLMGIAKNYHLCVAYGFDPDEVFRSVADVSLPFIARLLTNFINRPPELKSMEAFGLTKTILEDGAIEIDW